jgi:hypothetical protein
MTGRDRMVLIGVIVLAVLAGGWLLIVSPERKQAATAQTQIETARQQLESAQSQAASARSAEQRYTAAYKSVVSLGKAVPPTDEVPSLIYQLDQASNQRDVDFNSITSGTGSASSVTAASPSSSSASSSSSSSAAASALSSGFTQMPFTFVFKGTFEGLAHLLGQIDGFVDRKSSGEVLVSGRLLTVQGADITVETGGSSSSETASSGSGSGSGSGSEALSATITATAYVLPASQGLTAGLTAPVPGAPSSSTASASTPATPAVVRVAP